MAATTPTTASQDIIAPSVTQSHASAYLLHLISLQLKRSGFDAVEAGALSEVLRLTERYTQTLYQRASSLAAHSSRHTANAKDLFEAYHSLSACTSRSSVPAPIPSGTSGSQALTEQVERLRKTARRDKRARAKGRLPRNGLQLNFTSPPPSPPRAAQLTLSDSDTASEDDEWEEVPIAGSGGENKHKHKRPAAHATPSYLFEGAPRLPPEHSYRRRAVVDDADGLSHGQNQHLSTTLLSFIKATAVERGDIPSELGLVDYRRAGEAEAGSNTKKRRWLVRAQAGSGSHQQAT